MTHPLVSILMPLYNAEQWVEETIRSCQEQTYTNWELIIVDDGSTDASASIVEKIASSEPRITLLQQPNAGACVARNLAFRHCKGDYVMYLDADDLISPDKIELQVEVLSHADPETVAICAWEHFSDIPSAEITSRPYYQSYGKPIEFLTHMWETGGMMQPSCYLIPRQLIVTAGEWNEALTLNQDGEFMCRVLANATSIVWTDKAIVHYRRGHASISTSNVRAYSKQRSRLDSFISYEQTLLPIADSPRLRQALARNYALVACATGPKSTLFKEAFATIKSLGLKPRHPYPSTLYGKIANLIGLKLYLELRSFFDKFLYAKSNQIPYTQKD